MRAVSAVVVATVVGWGAACPTVAAAEAWRGSGRLGGVVTDLDDRPIARARVTLRPLGAPGEGPPATATDAAGGWEIAGLAPGRWTIRVKAAGYLTSEGWVDVRDNGDASPVRVALRPLGEVSPAFAETPGSITRWLEKGNDLLEQGRYEAARDEYQKALELLPPESRAEVLRAMARTWFLQGRPDETVSTLLQALAAAPEDEATRRLLTEVLRQLGRESEAAKLLAAIDREGAEALAKDVVARGSPDRVADTAAGRRPELAELPVEPPRAGRTGRYRTSFTVRSPRGDLDELLRRLGLDRRELAAADLRVGPYDVGREVFHVYVPAAAPRSGRYGILVYVSPSDFGGFAGGELREVLDERGLIWIAADHAGNRRARWTRMSLALDAVHNLRQLYGIDDRRVYVSGYSGGGRIASGLAMLYPEVFRGGLSLFGCDYFRRVDMPDKPGAYWPPRFPPPPDDTLERIRSASRFVLLTGELDFNRAQAKAVYEIMKEDGFEHVSYLVVPGASHYHALEKRWLELGIAFLEGGTAPG